MKLHYPFYTRTNCVLYNLRLIVSLKDTVLMFMDQLKTFLLLAQIFNHYITPYIFLSAFKDSITKPASHKPLLGLPLFLGHYVFDLVG